MMATGCSDKLARAILNKVGRDKGPLVIMIICFVVLVSGNTGHTWVLLPVLLSICRECDMPRGIGMMAYVAMVQITQFDLVGIPGFPNVLVAQALVSVFTKCPSCPLSSTHRLSAGVHHLYDLLEEC